MLITPMLHQGGFERICVLTARLLQERGYQPVIVVFSMEDVAFDISGLTVIDLKLGSRKSRAGKLFNIIRRCLKLSTLQRKLQTDISYSFGMTANIANALSFGAGKKITACHSFEEIKSRLYMRLISRHSAKVLCCSKKMADLVEESYHFRNVYPLWNPCDTENVRKYSAGEPDQDIAFFRTGDRVLVSMGREDDVKGFWHLLKIFKRVNEEEKDTRLAIIGDGDFSEYEKLAKELSLKDKVFFTGLKKNPFPYLRESDIYILTSLSEGLPNALVEALALSLPIVSANCLSGPAEILHEDFKFAESRKEVFPADYGILTPVLSPEKNMTVAYKEDGSILTEESEEQFAQAVLMLLRDQEQYNKYKVKAKKRAEDFSAVPYLEGLLALMEQ